MLLAERLRNSMDRVLHPASSVESSRRPDVAPKLVYSAAFTAAQQDQRQIDERYSSLPVADTARYLAKGQDHIAHVISTNDGRFVTKRLLSTSRFNLIFGLGIPAAQVPADTEPAARQQLVKENRHKVVDTKKVAEKTRLVQNLAMTYLGDELQPTAIVEKGGDIYNVQRFLPRIPETSSSELSIQRNQTEILFSKLNERWKTMLATPDFSQMPPDVQDYWKTYPPDHGFGTNVIFLGVDDTRVIDY